MSSIADMRERLVAIEAIDEHAWRVCPLGASTIDVPCTCSILQAATPDATLINTESQPGYRRLERLLL